MPLYVYQCTDCGVRFEATQSFHDAPLTTCPECNGSVYRVIGSTGVIFKGSGFYVTDNRKSSGNGSAHRSGAKSDEKSSDASEAKSSSETPSSSAPAASAKTDD
jgi:putative FmdB family regulatory protein